MDLQLKEGSTGITREGEVVTLKIVPKGKILTLGYRSDKHRRFFSVSPEGWYCSPDFQSEHDVIEKVSLK